MADDNPIFLGRLTSLLSAEFDVVATAADGQSALVAGKRQRPDLFVLDLAMPALNGIEVTSELAKHSQSPPVVICSAVTDLEVVDAAREAGALGYVFKARIEQDLVLAVKSVLQGKPFVSAGSSF